MSKVPKLDNYSECMEYLWNLPEGDIYAIQYKLAQDSSRWAATPVTYCTSLSKGLADFTDRCDPNYPPDADVRLIQVSRYSLSLGQDKNPYAARDIWGVIPVKVVKYLAVRTKP